ncbi:major facilitator superfamily transporter [Apiospora phragmitis]|uniref:Major facilitator superfamily transporter n=1 Tax=Apiospora phragmitis TaxID=2905665 RepID=A0ABR1U9X3_9PEZI
MAYSNSELTARDLGSSDPEAVYEMAEKADNALDWKPNIQQLLTIITLAIVCLVVALDASIIGDTTEGFWVGTSYLLVNAVTMPVIASISEIFGRPLCLEFSLVMFTLGTILCCTATDIAVMLVGRSIQGVGIQVLSGVIMTDIVLLRHRPKWYGVVLAAWALGTCVGPIIGGGIAQNITWRWVFYLMFPICAYGLVAVPLPLKSKPRTESLSQKLRRVDWVGMILFMGSTTSTIAPLVIGLTGLVVTMLWEIYFASEPILKPSLFHNASSTATYICGAAQGFLIWSSFYYYPFYFLSVKMTSPVMAGVNMLPAVLVLVPGFVITGRLVTRFDNYRLAIWLGWAFAVVSAVVSVAWQFLDVSTAVWVVTFILLGLGHGAVLNAQNFATQAMCQEGDEGHAAAMYLFIRQIGAAIGVGGVFQVYLGVAVFSLIISLVFIKHFTLNKALVSEHVLEGSPNGAASTSKVSWDQQTLESQAYSGVSTPFQGHQMLPETTAPEFVCAPVITVQQHQSERTVEIPLREEHTQPEARQPDVSPMSQYQYPPEHSCR